MLNKKVEEALNAQINREMFSSYLYQAMSAHLTATNLLGFANWMKVQAQEEMCHAMIFYHQVLDRGGRVGLRAIDAPPSEWPSVLNIFQESYKHELFITKSIDDLMNLAVQEKDHATANFLQWFVSEQVEEEANAILFRDKLALCKDFPGGVFMLDKDAAARAFVLPAPLTGKL